MTYDAIAAALLASSNASGLSAVEEEVQNLIEKHGDDAVKKAVAALTKPRRGRKPEPDSPEIDKIIVEEAIEFLNSGDTLSKRSIFFIAEEYYSKHGGHSHSAVTKRIRNKLSKKPNDRRFMVLQKAIELSRSNFPYRKHIESLEEMIAYLAGSPAFQWKIALTEVKIALIKYEAAIGKVPDDLTSIQEIEDIASNPFASLKFQPSMSEGGGLFGLLRPLPPANAEPKTP